MHHWAAFSVLSLCLIALGGRGLTAYYYLIANHLWSIDDLLPGSLANKCVAKVGEVHYTFGTGALNGTQGSNAT